MKFLADLPEIRYTPNHAGWLDMAESELRILVRLCLNRRIDNAEELARGVAARKFERNAAKTKAS